MRNVAQRQEPTIGDPFGLGWEDLPVRLPRRRGSAAPVGVALLAAVILGLGIVVLAAAQSIGHQAPPPRAEAAQPPLWIDIVKPIALFGLDMPDISKDARIYVARRHSEGGGRQDTLGFGRLDGPDPYLRLMVYRIGNEARHKVSFYVDLARRAAAAGLSIGHGLKSQEAMTRFGLFEVADVDLMDKEGLPTPCLGFRSANDDLPVQMAGFACGSKAKPLSRPGLVCLIERLDLNSAGEDQVLARFFAEAELKRTAACNGNALAPAATRASWLDQADALPPLKARKAR
jgi:hypothetical protein